MLPDVKTPLLSGIPYMFRFSAPKKKNATTVGDDRKLMRWATNHLDISGPYMGLKSRYSQTIINPVTVVCLCSIAFIAMFKTFLISLLNSSMAYAYLSCSSSSLEASQYGRYYQYSKGVMQVFNQSNVQAVEQYLYTVNATLWNLQASTHQYLELLGAHYQTIQSGIPRGAFLASKNVTDTLGSWAQAELSDANGYVDKLLHNIQSAMGELGGSATNKSRNITTAVPTGINDNLVEINNAGNEVFFNITSNSQLQLDTLFANASSNIARMLSEYQVGLPSNITLVPQKYQTNGCTEIINQFEQLKSKLNSRYKIQAALFSLAAVLFIIISVLYMSFKWRKTRIIVNNLCSQHPNTPKSTTFQLHKYDNLVVGCLNSLMHQSTHLSLRAKNGFCLVMSYAMSSSFMNILSLGWLFIIFSLCVANLHQVLNGSIVINLDSNTPYSSVSFDLNSTNINMSISQLNSHIGGLEDAMNTNISSLLTGLVTDVNSIVTTVNRTMMHTSQDTLSSVNLTDTANGLNFSLIYEDGFAFQQITLLRLSTSINTTIKDQRSILLENNYVFSLQNISSTCSTVESTLRATGLTLVSTWLGALIIGTVYLYLALCIPHS